MNCGHQSKTPPPMIHGLKIAPEHFAGQLDGTKTFELRVDDRDFTVGDTLCLREWAAGEYTGRWLTAGSDLRPTARVGYLIHCGEGRRAPTPGRCYDGG